KSPWAGAKSGTTTLPLAPLTRVGALPIGLGPMSVGLSGLGRLLRALAWLGARRRRQQSSGCCRPDDSNSPTLSSRPELERQKRSNAVVRARPGRHRRAGRSRLSLAHLLRRPDPVTPESLATPSTPVSPSDATLQRPCPADVPDLYGFGDATYVSGTGIGSSI